MFVVQEGKVTSSTALDELYSLNDYQQRNFDTCIRFKAVMKNTHSMEIVYDIPQELGLFINISDLGKYCHEIDERLVGVPADYIYTHLIIMEVISEKLNPHSIGVCLDSDVKNIMLLKMERK